MILLFCSMGIKVPRVLGCNGFIREQGMCQSSAVNLNLSSVQCVRVYQFNDSRVLSVMSICTVNFILTQCKSMWHHDSPILISYCHEGSCLHCLLKSTFSFSAPDILFLWLLTLLQSQNLTTVMKKVSFHCSLFFLILSYKNGRKLKEAAAFCYLACYHSTGC